MASLSRADAAAELLRRRTVAGAFKPPPLLEFVGLTDGLSEPRHLADIAGVFERVAAGESVRVLVSVAPQHGKSLLALHALVWLLRRNPRRRHAYATYAQEFSRDQSGIATRVAAQHFLSLERDTLDRWRTPAGGGVVWTSRGGPLAGHPVDGVLIVDDLLKDREEADSRLIREKAFAWLSGVAFTRVHPGGSIVIIATRWHLDDPIGRLLEAGGWEHVCLPAVREDGEALWPEERPLEWLLEQKARLLPRDWSALYLCAPVAEGERVFGPPAFYDELPAGVSGEEHGFDAAYTARTTSDWTVTISGRVHAGRLYVTNLLRHRLPPEDYVPLMLAAGVRRVHWFGSGTELGLVPFLEREGVRVSFHSAGQDKLARAYPVAVAWNRGEVLLPRAASWVGTIENEVGAFTGRGDAHDDVVDALSALWEGVRDSGAGVNAWIRGL